MSVEIDTAAFIGPSHARFTQIPRGGASSMTHLLVEVANSIRRIANTDDIGKIREALTEQQ